MRKNTFRKISLITLSCLFVLGTITIILFGVLKPSAKPFRGSKGNYVNDQVEIFDYETPTIDNSIDISTLYTLANLDTGEIIENASPRSNTVININSALDLYAFSKLTNQNDLYLGYKYQLLANINYDDCPYAFEPVAWREGKLFNGEFNGNGFEVSNLDLVKISEDSKGQFTGIHYFAMFSKLGPTARLTKLGLRDTNIVINAAIDDLAIASMVGYIAQGAEVSYIFATDLRDPILDEAGITASGGYRISGLVYQNEGTLKNAYTAYTSVSNYTVTDYIDFSEILTINTGSATNLFFYNSSILSFLSPGEGRDKYRIEYKAPISKIFEVSTHYGEYVETMNELDSRVLTSDTENQWFTKNSYVDLAVYLDNITTPIARGLSCSKDSSGGYHFEILNEQDFGYMFELMNHNAKFATESMIYEIHNDLNLDLINPLNYYYNRSIGATIKGIEIPGGGSVTLADGSKSTSPTIYNPSLTNKVITEGINAYGLFPWLTGSVMDLNIIIEREKTTTINVLDTDIDKNNIKALGILSGYANGANINNVNTFANITIDSSIGKYFVGGAIGIFSGLGDAVNLTTAGSITVNNATVKNMSSPTGYMEGVALAGAIAYIDRTYASLNNVMSVVDLSVFSRTNYDMVVGGVVGAGYAANLDGIENRGTINIGRSGANASFNRLYVSGAIGRLLGVKSQIANINNQALIDVYIDSNIEGYISGIMNADIITKSTSHLDASSHRVEGSYYLYARDLKNQANVKIHSALKDGSGYTQGINLLSRNGFKTIISGVSNLGYSTINGVDINIAEELIIDMSIVNKYAPVINVINNDRNNTVELDTIYNLRDIKLSANSALPNKEYLYSGVVNGKYISFIDISNEGNITIDLGDSTTLASANSLIVNGVFEALSNNHTAENIFNDGNITIDSKSQNLAFNIYASGIAYKNEAVLSDALYNPLLPDFDKESKGSFNNVINNGEIKITSTNYSESSTVNDNLASYISGDIYASGIVGINNGIISNTFNLGSINILLSLPSSKGMYASGIAYMNDGEFAQIKDSANNGAIKAINVGSTDPIAYASGIASKNTANLINTSQIIAFTINYGEVYAFSSVPNDSTIDTNEKVKAGGFLAEGLCNLINTINYGNVFSTNTAGGMIGAFKLNANSPAATIANTLNYGIVKAINAYETVDGTPTYMNIKTLKEITPTSKYITTGKASTPTYQFIGALIGVADYSALNNKIKIRYLVNFFEGDTGVLIVSKEMNAPSNVSPEVVKTLYNVKPNNKFLGIDVTYAPLSTISDEYGNIGVFAPEFGFRQAIAGKNLDNNSPTDKYIGDFFQFIGFEKINDVIFEKVGWGQIAYMDAAERFARDLTSIVNLLNLSNINKNDAILDEAINDDAWLNRCDNTILNNLLDEISNGNLDTASLKELVRFLLFEGNGHNIVSAYLRETIINQIYTYLVNSGSDAYTILNSLLYEEVLAKIVAGPNGEYTAISDEIRRIISSASNLDSIMDSYIEALRTYITSDPRPNVSLVDPLFDSQYEGYYYKAKITLLNTILAGYSDEQLQNLLKLVSGENTDNRTKYLLYLDTNQAATRDIYTHIIASNNFNNHEYNRLMNQAFKRYGVADIIFDGTKNIDSSMMNRVNDVFAGVAKQNVTSITSLNQSRVGDYVALWNLIKKNGQLRQYLNTILPEVQDELGSRHIGIYAKATEHNNTYQSNDSPSGELTNLGRQSLGGKNRTKYSGKTRVTNNSDKINTRFIFTPDRAVSDKTYYYGPFKTPAYNIWYPGYDSDNYNLGFNLTTTGTGQNANATVRYVPFFASLDEEELLARGATNIYQFLWSDTKQSDGHDGDSSNQWVTPHILTKEPFDSTTYLYKNYSSEEIIANGYYDFDTPRSTSEELATSSNNPDNSNLKLASKIGDMSGSVHTYAEHYLKANITADMITGIWYQQNIWAPGGVLKGAYLTAKDNTPYYTDDSDNAYYGVVTTEYIDYSINDLIALDGKLTKPKTAEKGLNKSSADERQIINELMEKIVSTKEGQRVVMNAVASAAERNIGKQQLLAEELLEAALNETSFVDSLIKDITYDNLALDNIKYQSTPSATLRSHFEELISTLDLTNKDEIINAVVNNKEAFIKLLVEAYDRAKLASAKATIPISNINDFVYRLITNNPNLSPTEIDNLLALANDSDLNNLVDIYKKKIPINTSFSIYTITSDSWTYNEGTFGSYNKELVALNNNSTLSFTTDKEKLRIVYSGAINVNGTRYQNTSMQERTFNLSGGANTLTADANTKIYLLEAKTDGTLIGTAEYHNGKVSLTGNQNSSYSEADFKYTLTRSGNTRGGIEIDLSSITTEAKLFYTKSGSSIRIREDNSYFQGNVDGTNGIAIQGGHKYLIQGNSDGNNSFITNLRIEYSGNVSGINYKITQKLVPTNVALIPGDLNLESTSYDAIEVEHNGIKENVNLGGTVSNLNGKVDGAISFYTKTTIVNGEFSSVENEVVARIEDEYNKLNSLAKQIFDSTLTIPKISGFNIVVDKPSYIFVEATGTGELSINGVNKAVEKGKTYVYSLDTAGNYTPGGSVGYTNPRLMDKLESLTLTSSGSDNILAMGTKEIINFDYSALNGFFTNLNIDSVNKHEDFIKIYGVRNDSNKVSLRKADLIELIMTLFPTMKTGANHEQNPNQWILFLPNTKIPEEERIFKRADLINLAKMIAKADYEANTGSLAKLYDQYNDLEGLKQILKLLTNNERVLKLALSSIQAQSGANEAIKDLFKAALIGDDFLKKNEGFKLTEAKMYAILNQYTANDGTRVTHPYQFIVDDTSIDSQKFKELMQQLGFDLTTEGYGIYALSSSKGILNGSFIPDNVVLSKLDKYYDNNLHLTNEKSPSWRGGNSNNPNNPEVGSVNEAVLKSMKQLKKSISTTIFNLDLIDSNGTIHKSSESSIDLNNKTITYYVPLGYIDSLADKSLTPYGGISLANGATHILKDGLAMAAEIADGIIVTAEDITVVSNYKLIFEEIAIDFTLDYKDGTTSKAVASTGEEIILRATSSQAHKLPEGMDLTLFLNVKRANGEAINNIDAFSIANVDNNGVVNSLGNAEIRLNINPSLRSGEYKINLDIFSTYGGSIGTVTLTKNASDLNLITSFVYEGVDYTAGFTEINGHLELETEIEFGRAFDYTELTSQDDSSFYLNKLEYSSGAMANITATKSIADGIMTYEVSFIITAENGNTKTYIHRLIEKTPFTTGDRYVSVYENGEAEENIREYDSTNASANVIKKSFERGFEPQYSVKYSLSKFYLADTSNISYRIDEAASNNPGSAIIDIYSGMMITVTESSEPGEYIFTYAYSSKGTWNDGEYIREYSFPSLKITKNYSKDATLKKISFIDSHEVLGSLATIMDPTTSIRPNVIEGELQTYVDESGVAHKEINYNSVTDGNRKIKIEKGNIEYGSYFGYKDYFTIGTISNASLDSYNPTFKLEEHASIFMSTTLEKLRFFGTNQGGKSDMEVLTNHDTTFIYVPFKSGDLDKNFLVQIENGEWTNVFYESFRGTPEELAAPVANLTGGVREFVDNADGRTWVINPIAGKPVKENLSLQADYIGTPQDGHFWYVSYVVFSEDYINKTGPNENLTYYHIALIDQTNTVYFDISLKAPMDIDLESIYITLAYANYDDNDLRQTNQISGYVKNTTTDINALEKVYRLEEDLQILPSGYYYFLVDLPVGYVCEARITNNRPNRNDRPDTEMGAYLPPSSIVTQRVSVELTVVLDTQTLEGNWGASIGDIGTKVAKIM